jgi:hypothetical protein
MKRAGLQRSKFFGGVILLILSSIQVISPTSASALPTGTAPCVQSVDSTTGVSVYRDGNACYVAFKSVQSYTWTPPTGVTNIDLLIVAGGGGGGSRHAGGGGAGGLINSTNLTINSSNLSITIGGGGAGGAATSSTGNNGSDGSNSVVSGGGITTQTALGGGGGAYNSAAGSGGSGGGGGCCGQAQGTGSQGSAGNSGFNNGYIYVGGGGGGAGAAGTAANSSGAGSGGVGLAISWITANAQSNLTVGHLVTSQTYFAGGGGGSTNNVGTAGSGGNGGGGAGSATTSAGTNATTNTGGGGGGGGLVGAGAAKGGDGGSGVVVIRYLMPVFTNSATASIAENTSTSTNAATVTVSESSTITIRPLVDSSFFTVVTVDSVTARIRFITSPDFEAKADTGGNNDYDITIRATNMSGNYSESTLKITVTDVVENASIGVPSLSGTAYKGLAVTITVTSNTPGKMRFFVSGKRIPNCLAQLTSGSYPNFSATCSWEPATSGSQRLMTTLTPTDVAISTATSQIGAVFVSKRSNLR